MVAMAIFSVFQRRDDILSAMGVSDAMTEAEYIEALDKLSGEILELQARTDEIDADDVEAAKAHIDELKGPFDDFAAIEDPPKAFAEGHAKIQSGCHAMTEYLDLVKSIVGETDEEKLSLAAEQMIGKLSQAMEQLKEGTGMVEKAME